MTDNMLTLDADALAERVNSGAVQNELNFVIGERDGARARIAELEAEIRATEEAGVAGIRQWVERAWKAEAEAGRLRAALEEIAEGRFYCADGDCRAIETAQAALSHADEQKEETK